MLMDTPAYTRRSGTRPPSVSPSCRTTFTPTTLGHPSPGPSLFSPSPFHSTFAFPSVADDTDADGPDFDSSPFMSPPPRKVHGRLPGLHSSVARPPPMPIDDDEGGIFLSSTPRGSPLRGRSSLENSFRAALSPVQPNTATRVAKRKSTPSLLNSPDVTPLRQRVLTPLNTAPGNFSFDRLAPLPAPRFGQSTPQLKAETDASLHKQTASMTRLRIGERADSGIDSDSDEQEIAAAISPDGHVTKRRARSRPVSAELRGTVHSPPGISQLAFPSGPALNFSPPDPSSPTSSSSSDAASPFRRRMSSSRPVRTRTASNVAHLRSIPMARLPSGASLFFGPAIPNSGCPTSHPQPVRPALSTRHSFAGSGSVSPWPCSPEKSPQKQPQFEDDEDMFFSGLPDTSFSFDGMSSSSPNRMVSQGRGLPKKYKPRDSGVCLSEEEEQSFRLGAALAALEKSSDWGVPSASTSVSTAQSSSGDEFAGLVTPMIGPGDTSGWPRALIVGTDGEVEEEEDDVANASFRTQPEIVDEFIKRTLAAGAKDTSAGSVPEEHGGKRAPGTPVKKVRTAFTGGRPWQSAFANGKIGFSFGNNGEPVPTNKVKDKKKARMSLPAGIQIPQTQDKSVRRKLPGLALAVGRKSVMIEDSDSEGEKDSPSAMRQMKYENLGLGRPSRPTGVAARARMLMRRSSSGQFESGSESPGSAGTPTRLSKVWPTPRLPSQLSPASTSFKGHRKNSGSSGSGSFGSPTIRRAIKDLPISSPKPLRSRKSGVEHLHEYVEVPSFRLPPSTPGPSSLAYPAHTAEDEVAVQTPPSIPRVRLASMTAEDHRDGYFDREFVEIDDLGSGEFGKAMKVRRKDGPEGEVFAVKRSRRFEGARQRLRLREELDVLKHLSRAAKAQGLGDRHPNVLGYVDGWEQDETLYILTELCELGNYASFLWRFGTIFPRLDEARVWKILADLSNGLRFVHDNGVIHLDLKPANIFVTADGRFKIGDFGMASLWPRPPQSGPDAETSFEREGDKLYLAAEVLQGQYGKAADIFSLGMIMLETAANIVVPDQGEPWHRLRREDFSQVGDMDASPELFALIRAMMRADPAARLPIEAVHAHLVVARARAAMEHQAAVARAAGTSLYAASPLAGVEDGFLEAILGRPALLAPSLARVDEDDDAMDLSA